MRGESVKCLFCFFPLLYIAFRFELALAARAPGKKYHHCVLLGHSFGGLVLENTISHSILDASATGARNTSPWDMAVAFNPADNSIGSRQLMSELDYLQ